MRDEVPGQRDNRRLEHIAVAAYYRAEKRGFQPGGELEDWLEAERSIPVQGSNHDVLSGSAEADSLADADFHDHESVRPGEIEQQAKQLRTTPENLRLAISRVGSKIADVKTFLHGSHREASGNTRKSP